MSATRQFFRRLIPWNAHTDALEEAPGQTTNRGSRRPVLTLLLLAPAIGELLSGSSPPVQFFNPVFLLILVGLYGCGALLVREVVVRRGLNISGLLLLGIAYAIIEEGLTCKSFFNPYWNDVGYLGRYGRALGVNWIWTLGLIVYHSVVSITVPIFLTEALFSRRAAGPWLRQRGCIIAGVCLGLVMLLGFLAFDSPQFHVLEIRDAPALALKLRQAPEPLAEFIASRMSPRNRRVLLEGATKSSPKLRHAIADEFNRLLASPELYTQARFSSVVLPESVQKQLSPLPKGDKLVRLNRALLEAAFPQELHRRNTFPFRPAWPLTLGCLALVGALVALAVRQRAGELETRRPLPAWRHGLWFSLGFVVLAFVLAGLVENGAHLPAWVAAGLWMSFGALVWRTLRRLDREPGRLWRRGLWALGVLSPWTLTAALLGLAVQLQGAKSFAGMTVVAAAAAVGIGLLAWRWRRELADVVPGTTATTPLSV